MLDKFCNIRAFAVINRVHLPVTSVSTTFGINSIPTATIQLATGYSELGPQIDPAKALRITERDTCEIYGTLNEVKFKMFDGYVKRPVFERSFSSLGISYVAEHWLSDLTQTSKVSDKIHPQGAGDYILGKIAYGDFAGGNSGLKALNLPQTTDVAEFVIALLRSLNKLDGAINSSATIALGIDKKKPSEAVEYQLEKLQGKLRLPTGGRGVDHTLETTLSLSKMLLSPSSGTTFWDMLMFLANQLHFTIVPTIDECYLAPVTPISDRELVLADDSIIRQLYPAPAGTHTASVGCVVLLDMADTISNFAGVSAADLPQHLSGAVWGRFPSAGSESGTTLVLEAEPFLHALKAMMDQNARGEEDRLKEKIAKPKLQPSEEDKRQWGNITYVGNLMAQAKWVESTFGERQMTLGLAFRPDIAPGTNVRIEVSIPKQGQQPEVIKFHGIITEITHEINAESESATSTARVMCVHTDAERANAMKAGIKPDAHALFPDEKWDSTTINLTDVKTFGELYGDTP